MMRGITILWILLAVIAGVSLYLLKHDVQTMEERLADLNRQITKDRTAIHVLQAEWTYLNDPERLRTLVAKHLPDLRPMGSDQVSTLAALPWRASAEQSPVKPTQPSAPRKGQASGTAAPTAQRRASHRTRPLWPRLRGRVG